MTNKQELRYDLLKANQYDTKNAKACYDFVMGEDETPATIGAAQTGQVADGIYLVYADGHAEDFTGANDKEGVKYVGVAFRGNTFAVSLTETGEVVLLPENSKRPKEYQPLNECQAIYDFDSFGNTERLVKSNPELRSCLKEGEAIPALGLLVIMCYHKEQINQALAYVGGQQLTDTWYWSSTEYLSTGAWLVNFSSGYTNTSSKSGSNAVRAVAAF